MIYGVGADVVLVERFIPWVDFVPKQQRVIFSQQELDYCFHGALLKHIIAQRMAARFAAKEAFYKALSSYVCALNVRPVQHIYLKFLCKNIQVIHDEEFGVPSFDVQWAAFEKKIGCKLDHMCVKLSLSHERSHALAFVVISLTK